MTPQVKHYDLAAGILELTILDAGNVMTRVGEMFLELVGLVEEAQAMSETETACADQRATRMSAIRSKVSEIVIELQWNDISEQRLNHVLAFLRDPQADVSILAEASEQKLASLMALGMPVAEAIDSIQHNSSSDIDLF